MGPGVSDSDDEPMQVVEEPISDEDAGEPEGVILILGKPDPILPSGSCYVEVSLPDGSRSIVDHAVERDAVGKPRSVRHVVQLVAPENGALEQGG